MDENDGVYGYSQMAYHLLTNYENMEDLEKQIFSVDPDNTKETNTEHIIYSFELLLNIAMDMIFQYLQFTSIAELVDEDGCLKEDTNINEEQFNHTINKYSISELECLLKPRLKKICVLTFIHETISNDSGYYCKTIFSDTCEDKYKHKFENDTRFHFIFNANFDESSVKNIDDLYTIFNLHGNLYKLKFSVITKHPIKLSI
jgi:hypothetical protein